jgi:hypothetical protein
MPDPVSLLNAFFTSNNSILLLAIIVIGQQVNENKAARLANADITNRVITVVENNTRAFATLLSEIHEINERLKARIDS